MNKKSITVLVLFLAIVCIFTIASVLIMLNNSDKNQRFSLDKNLDKGINNNTNSTINNIKKKNKFELIGKDKNNWNVYRSYDYGFEISYPDFLNVVGEDNTIITNVQGDSPTFFAQDGDIWISVRHTLSDKINVFDKIGQTEKNYDDKLGNQVRNYYSAEFLDFDAVISSLEYSNGKILIDAGIYKTLYFKNNSTVNIISAHIPSKNKKQIELFDKILKTIKFID